MTLLERTTREVRLTDAGRDLAEDAAAVIAAADAAFARASAAGEGLSGIDQRGRHARRWGRG